MTEPCSFCQCDPLSDTYHQPGCQCDCHLHCECDNCLSDEEKLAKTPKMKQALMAYGIRPDDKRPSEYLEDRSFSAEDRVMNYCRTHSIEGFKTLELFMPSLLKIVDGNYDPSDINQERALTVLSKTVLEHMISQKLLDKSKTLGGIPLDDWVQRILRNQ